MLVALAAAAMVGPAYAVVAGAAIRPAPAPPTYVGAYQPHGVDEIGLWRDADEEERQVTNSPLVIRDATLNSYVKGVLCETVGTDRCNSVRVYILRTPLFNANMSPNGMMRVYSGLLLRTRDEAELGTVLAHEFGHYERRHTLSHFKARRSGSDLMSWAAVLTAMAGTYEARSSFNNLQLSVYGGLYRYQRNEEREADLLAVSYLNSSALPPQSASKIWLNQMAEAEASASARGLSKPRYDSIAFSASHPPDRERATYLSELAAPEGATRDPGADRYAKALAPWLPQFLDDHIKLNDFGASEYLITSLAGNGWTAPLWLARGDLYRIRGNPRDLVSAANFYSNAVALAPSLPEAQRGLGLSLIKTGHSIEGRAALARYLALRPDAADSAMIGMIVGKESQ